MSNCVAEIDEWMGSNRLKLNPSKTELIWLGSSRRLEHCPVGELNIAGVPIKPATHVRDLGVMIDNDLSLQVHINHVTRTCFYHLRQLRVVRRSLTTDKAHSLVRALVHSRLDYCNGVSLVCFSTRSIGFNPFSVPQLALSLAYPSGPAFRAPCTTNYTGSPSQKGSSSNSVASSTSVYTIAHPGICLNTAYRSIRIPVIPVIPVIAYRSLTPEICGVR